MDFEQVGKIIDKYEEKRTALISILHDIQDRYNHLPEGALRKVASRLKMDLNDIYGVATFYKSFSLVPKGKHSITLCLGTACHVRGGPKILREMKKQLNIEPGQTTADKQFSLNVVNCLGVCAIGPVMFVDGKFYGEMNPVKAKRTVEKINRRKSGVKS
ncbi:MAG: NAD(P)H-dependent oxidoreductase subunit E [Deltaproteobacteria bacterium]|nr:NAD(P)H-dependent oxidoreductase subunit E [Deltaproteobacteria bacterium]